MAGIKSPVAGTLVPLSQVPDAVFAEEMLGPGFAVAAQATPQGAMSEECVTAISPVSGTIAALKPHAFIVTISDGFSVLVHLGIDTVTGSAEQFETLESASGSPWQVGDSVTAGAPMIAWTLQGRPPETGLVMTTLLDLDATASINRVQPEGAALTTDTDVIDVTLP